MSCQAEEILSVFPVQGHPALEMDRSVHSSVLDMEHACIVIERMGMEMMILRQTIQRTTHNHLVSVLLLAAWLQRPGGTPCVP